MTKNDKCKTCNKDGVVLRDGIPKADKWLDTLFIVNGKYLCYECVDDELFDTIKESITEQVDRKVPKKSKKKLTKKKMKRGKKK